MSVGRVEDGSEDLARALVASGWRPTLSSQSYSGVPVVGAESDPLSHVQFVRAVYPPVGPEHGSVLDAAFLDTPVAYGTAFVPAAPAAASEAAFIPRPACQKESDILQNYIYANQHPSDCKTRRLFVRRHMPSYGLFAGLGLSTNYLFLASVLDRTLIDLSPNTYFTGNCPSNGLDCAFLPIGNCTAADFQESEVCYSADCFESARVISIDHLGLGDYLPCAATEYPVQRCSKDGPRPQRSLHQILPGLSQGHGEQFFQGEFSRYLTRPNKRLMEFAAARFKELKISDQLIGVHVRHGDKIGEGIQFPTQAYGLVVRRAVQVTGIKTVFIGSDDTSVYTELPKFVDMPDVRYVWLDPEANPIVHSAHQAAGHGSNTIGLALMAQAIIMTQAQAYIGTRSSMFGQIVFAMQGNDCSRQKTAYDMYGDLFYNSWYCRSDAGFQHAGREWMCAMSPPDKGTWIWKFGGSKTQC